MPLTGSSIVSRGLGGGLSRATRGWVVEIIDADPIGLPTPEPLFSTTALDADGIQRLVYDAILDVRYVDVSQSRFAHPSSTFTGYAADGFWYEAGVLDPTHVPFQASWASEAGGPASLNRGELDRFPHRLFVLTTEKEVVLIDADTLKVWMRFVRASLVYVGVNGPFIGQPDVNLRAATFLEGFLVVATSKGLKVADFRNDRAYILRNATQTRSVLTGLANRNSPTYMDGLNVTNPARTMVADDCLCVDMVALTAGTDVQVHAAVGHPNGLTAVTVLADTVTHPITKTTPLDLYFALPWSSVDDGDLDATTPHFQDSGTNWKDKQIKPGDVLVDDLGDAYTIVEVDQTTPGDRLVLSPEMPIRSSFGYSIRRKVTAVLTTSLSELYFANGTFSVVVDRLLDWAIGATPLYLAGSFEVQKDQSPLALEIDNINDLALSGTDLYIATSLGVSFASAEDFEGGRNAEFRYSTTAVVDVLATNRILVGSDTECVAVTVDPETGNIVAAVTGVSSVITEISPSIQQAFRFFDNVGQVNALASYRNVNGPPIVEVP